MDFECMKKVVEDRHSVRVFKKQAIPEGVLETILGYSLVLPMESFDCRDALLP